MILGLLSDTHGQRRRTVNAVNLLKKLGAEAFIHCGDIGDLAALDDFAGLRIWIVRGNTDFFDAGAIRHAAALGITLAAATPLHLELGGRHLLVFHGHEGEFARLAAEAVDSGGRRVPPDCDYILHGHTHIACDIPLERVRLINPGALLRAVHYTVATLDLVSDEVKFWSVWDQEPPDGKPHQFIPHRGDSPL